MASAAAVPKSPLPPFNPALWLEQWRTAPALFGYHERLHAMLDSLDPGSPPVELTDELTEVRRKRDSVEPGSPHEAAIKAQAGMTNGNRRPRTTLRNAC